MVDEEWITDVLQNGCSGLRDGVLERYNPDIIVSIELYCRGYYAGFDTALGPAHAVLSGYNFDDATVKRCLAALRAETVLDEEAIALLEWILTIPEDKRAWEMKETEEAGRVRFLTREARMTDDNPFSRLTSRQMCVVMMLADGFTQAEVARRLGIRRDGVCRHVQRARKRLLRFFAN